MACYKFLLCVLVGLALMVCAQAAELKRRVRALPCAEKYCKANAPESQYQSCLRSDVARRYACVDTLG